MKSFKQRVKLEDGLQIPASAGAGKVLSSDASGNGTWQDMSAGTAYNTAPIGSTLSWSGKTNPPSDYVLMDGRSLTQAAFPAGFAFASAEVAAGNADWTVTGSNFTVPNYQDRFIFSAGAKAIGTKGGAETHTLTTPEIPAHGHAQRYYGSALAGTGSSLGGMAASSSGDVTSAQTTASTGGGGAHNNMPPYVTLALFVKLKGVTISDNIVVAPQVVVQEAWHQVGAAGEPAFQNSWANAAGLAPAGFRKDPGGRVYLRGVVKSGASGSVAFQLPAGYRPAYMVTVPAYGYNGALMTFTVQIDTSGNVRPFYSGTLSEFWFDPIDFDTGQTTFPVGAPVIPLVTTLPVGVGQTVYYQNAAMAALGVVWTLRHNPLSASPYKWESVGGAELFTQTDASLSLGTVATWTAITTAIAIPLTGDYTVIAGAQCGHTSASQGIIMQPAATGLAVGVPAAYSIFAQSSGSGGGQSMIERRYRANGISGDLVLNGYVGATGGTVSNRHASILPIRVG